MGGLKSKFRRPKSASRKDKEATSSKRNSKKKKTVNLPDSQSAKKTVDPRLPFSNYRQIFSIRNAWKAVTRTMEDCAKETLIRFLHQHPEHKDHFQEIKHMTEDDEMRASEDFESIAMDIYQLFDDVMNNLENVDAAFGDIRRAATSFPLNKKMIKDMKDPFVETIKLTLGSERFTEATEDNYKLLYKFVQDEMGKHLPDVEEDSNIEEDITTTTDEETAVKHDDAKVHSKSDGLANADEVNHNPVEARGS